MCASRASKIVGSSQPLNIIWNSSGNISKDWKEKGVSLFVSDQARARGCPREEKLPGIASRNSICTRREVCKSQDNSPVVSPDIGKQALVMLVCSLY